MEGTPGWRSSSGGLIEPRDPRGPERRLAVGLLIATLASVSLVQSPTFAVVLLGVLGAHELGHRMVARREGVEVSWPMFLPAPFFVGTLGALIRFHGRPRTRGALVRIGAAGPVLGTFVLFAVLLGRRWIGALPAPDPAMGRPLLFGLLGLPATDADPILYAAWVGALVTGMNLLPIGQLDGGHIWSGVHPSTARRAGALAVVTCALLGVAWPWWWAWLGAVVVLGAFQPLDGVGGAVEGDARASAVAAAACFVLCFLPAPW